MKKQKNQRVVVVGDVSQGRTTLASHVNNPPATPVNTPEVVTPTPPEALTPAVIQPLTPAVNTPATNDALPVQEETIVLNLSQFKDLVAQRNFHRDNAQSLSDSLYDVMKTAMGIDIYRDDPDNMQLSLTKAFTAVRKAFSGKLGLSFDPKIIAVTTKHYAH